MERTTSPRLQVLVWNEFRSERTAGDRSADIYPDGIHAAIAGYLGEDGDLAVRTAVLDEPEHGLTSETLDATDVVVWWSHDARDEVRDEVVERLKRRVLDGLGLVVLHSGHKAKIFNELMGSSCYLKWREGARSRVWVVDPGHPIASGLGEFIDLEREEVYGEHFDVPEPSALVFVSWFDSGEVFRSGLCYTRGRGKVFYFQPGHEQYPTYHHPDIRRVLRNAVHWAAPTESPTPFYGRVGAT